MYCNHKKFYERLDWDIDLYKPVIRIDKQDQKVQLDIGNLSHDCMRDVRSVYDVETVKGKGSNFSEPLPPQVAEWKKHFSKDIPESVITEWIKMKSFYKKEDHNVFFTVVVPPNTVISSDKKTKEYATFGYKPQIRYLRSKIHKFVDSCQIENFILVYEKTKNNVIHAHMLFKCEIKDEIDCSFDYVVKMADIMGFKKIKQMNINLHIRDADHEAIDYLCKLNYVDSVSCDNKFISKKDSKNPRP